MDLQVTSFGRTALPDRTAIANKVNPRQVHVVALTKPTETELGQWYFHRYVAQLPTAGEIVLFEAIQQLSDAGVLDGLADKISRRLAALDTEDVRALAAAGAEIIAHVRTRQWLATPFWIPGELRYSTPAPAAALPTTVFHERGELSLADEDIDYGYLVSDPFQGTHQFGVRLDF